MQLSVILTNHDLTSFIEQITPLRMTFRPRRVISLERPTKVELVAGAGLRLRGAARFTWEAFGVTLRSWQVLLVPKFVARGDGHVLAFDPVLEELDLKRVPVLLHGRIADVVKSGLAAQREKLVWDFEKHLSLVRPLPAKLTPAGEVNLGPRGGTVTVTSTELRLTLDFAFAIHRDVLPSSLRVPELEVASR